MNNKMPHTPLSTPLSGSARETELRLRNIFSGPKKRPPLPLLALMCAVCLLCGNLVSCQTRPVEEPDASDASAQGDASSVQSEPEPKTGLSRTPDLNRNGVLEELRLVESDGFDGVMLEVWENDEILFQQPGERMDGYDTACFLYTRDGEDYLLHYSASSHQGNYHYYYTLSDYSGEFEEVIQSGSVSFDINFDTPYHKEFDPEAIAAFMDEIKELLRQSEVLFLISDLELLGSNPSWLDDLPDRFVQDRSKSPLENLKAFQAAMPAEWTPPAPQPGASLPLDEPLEMIFLSGAGAWCTGLTLNPDGSFVGDYHDADGDIYYTCQFHGRFETAAQLTASSWYMILEELVLDTKYPVGEEWDEVPDWLDGPLHFISSEPNGFNGEDGKALEPGAAFIFYTPDATGHTPGTELYGATEFWSWWPDRHVFYSAADTLGCYGLHNLETGYGFFSDT